MMRVTCRYHPATGWLTEPDQVGRCNYVVAGAAGL